MAMHFVIIMEINKYPIGDCLSCLILDREVGVKLNKLRRYSRLKNQINKNKVILKIMMESDQEIIVHRRNQLDPKMSVLVYHNNNRNRNKLNSNLT